MNYMSSELAAQRRVVNSTETHFDLIDTVGKEYLGLNESGADGGDGAVKKRRGRPPNPDKEQKERKKPGPVKGFKRVADPNASRMRKPYKKRDKAGSVVVSAAPNVAQA